MLPGSRGWAVGDALTNAPEHSVALTHFAFFLQSSPTVFIKPTSYSAVPFIIFHTVAPTPRTILRNFVIEKNFFPFLCVCYGMCVHI